MTDRTHAYLDCAATTPVSSEVRDAMLPFLEGEFGNPSSRHRVGVRVASAITDARRTVARALGAEDGRVVFTAGGTEANNLAVLGAARHRRGHGRHVLIGPAEHSCVRAAAFALEGEGFEVEVGQVGADGGLDVDDFAARMRADTVVVANMLASNEHGAIYPMRRIAALTRTRAPHAHVHTDAVQALGKIDVDLEALGVDSVAVSAHKVHGPKGSGALALAKDVEVTPLFHGGGQEGGVRSGTENPAGIVGLARAIELAHERCQQTFERLTSLRVRLAEGLAEIDGTRLLSPGASSLPSIAAVLLPGVPAEVYLHHLEERGVMVSVGSACQSAKKSASPALVALGLDPEEVKRVLRFSFSRDTRDEEIDLALSQLRELTRELALKAG